MHAVSTMAATGRDVKHRRNSSERARRPQSSPSGHVRWQGPTPSARLRTGADHRTEAEIIADLCERMGPAGELSPVRQSFWVH